MARRAEDKIHPIDPRRSWLHAHVSTMSACMGVESQEIVVGLRGESTKDLEANVGRLVEWIDLWRKDDAGAWVHVRELTGTLESKLIFVRKPRVWIVRGEI